jgi:tight adherence protein B
MDTTGARILYGLIFLAVLLGVEGLYMFVRGTDRRQLAVNRRMKMAPGADESFLSPDLLRKRILGGPISQWLVKNIPSLEQAFWSANITITPARAALYCTVVFVLSLGVLMALGGMPFLVQLALSLVVAYGAPIVVLQSIVATQRKKFNEQLPDAINLITRGLQAGHPVPVALNLVAREMADPIGSQFGNALDEINLGRDRTAALRDIAARFPSPELLFFIAAVEMQREAGGNLVGILDNLVKIIRERANMKKKAFAVSAEGRLTAVIVGALPFLLLAYLLVFNRDFIMGSVDDPMFWPLMIGAFANWAVGMFMIAKLVNIKV